MKNILIFKKSNHNKMQSTNTNKENQKDNEEIKQINIRLEKLESSINDLIKMNEKLLEDNKSYKEKLEKLEKNYKEQGDKINNLQKIINKSEGKETEENAINDNIENLIKINNNETYNFVCNPSNLSYNKSITAHKNPNSLGEYILYNSFQDGNQYLISANKNNYNLNVYDLNNGNLIKSLHGHNNRIDHIRYFYNNNKSYFVSSDTDHVLIVWDENFNILNTINTGFKGSITNSYLLFHKNEKDYFIIIPSTEINEYTKIYDNKGKFIKNVYNTDKNVTFHLEVWNYNNNYYLIEAAYGKISVTNLFKDELYHEFIYNPESYHFNGIIYKQNYYITNTNTANINSYIRIYDLINKSIYKSIEVKNYDIKSLFLWNNKYLLSCNNGLIHKNIQIYNIETLKEEQRIIDGNIKISEVKAIKLNDFGESLVVSDEESYYKIFSIKK